MSALGREDLLKRAGDLPIEDVEVPGWGTVRVRGLSAAARDRYEASVVIMRRGRGGRMEEGRDFDNVRAKLVVMCLVDDAGDLLFKENEYDVLGQLPAGVVDQLWEVACKLSGMGEDDVAELVQDFGTTRGPSSDSPSPLPSGAPSASLAPDAVPPS